MTISNGMLNQLNAFPRVTVLSPRHPMYLLTFGLSDYRGTPPTEPDGYEIMIVSGAPPNLGLGVGVGIFRQYDEALEVLSAILTAFKASGYTTQEGEPNNE